MGKVEVGIIDRERSTAKATEAQVRTTFRELGQRDGVLGSRPGRCD